VFTALIAADARRASLQNAGESFPLPREASQRGSALLITLMVIVGFSLLGLGFIAVSKTESSVAISERNHAQVVSVAEAGASVVVNWFNQPEAMNRMGLLPPNAIALKPGRTLSTYQGIYRPEGLSIGVPRRGWDEEQLYGDETHPDVVIDMKTAPGREFLARFNDKLFGGPADGRVTQILLYAPPLSGGRLNARGFWEGGIRHGIASVKVTAARLGTGKLPRAETYVKAVVGIWPGPRIDEPVKPAGNAVLQGGIFEHWSPQVPAVNQSAHSISEAGPASDNIRYSFWKEIAIAGGEAGNRNIHYLEYSGDGRFTDGAAPRTVEAWLASASDGAFFFFDTKNGVNPQGRATKELLTDPLIINLSAVPLRGFVYLNASMVRLAGQPHRTAHTQLPGEPWNDRGLQRYDVSGRPVGEPGFGAGNQRWDYQDMNQNGLFDVVVRDSPDGSGWKPLPYSPGCVVAQECSEPHEPYVNLIYPSSGRGKEAVPGWEQPLTQTRRPKVLVQGQPPLCDQSNAIPLCTSNGFDEHGAIASDLKPAIQGVLYVEGDIQIDEPVEAFGAVHVGGDIRGGGRLDVYHDDRLRQGTWPGEDHSLPRVRLLSWLTRQR